MKPPKTMPLPWTVFADHRTSCSYLVYDNDGNFHADDSATTMDTAAAFIQIAVNGYTALEQQIDSMAQTNDALVKKLQSMKFIFRDIIDCAESGGTIDDVVEIARKTVGK